MIFINTRPESRSASLSHFLRKWGIEVYELPLLALLPIENPVGYPQYLMQLAQGDYAALIVISPSAAELGLQACHTKFGTTFLPNCPIIAVGNATAAVLKSAKWQPRCPKIASNEGLMVMSELASIRCGQKVLIWRGSGGRRLLIDHMQAKGVNVDAMAWYKRLKPSDLLEQFISLYTHIGSPKEVWMLISSAEAFIHWQDLIKQYNTMNLNNSSQPPLMLSHFRYLVLGARLEAIVAKHSTRLAPIYSQRIPTLDPSDILKALQSEI